MCNNVINEQLYKLETFLASIGYVHVWFSYTLRISGSQSKNRVLVFPKPEMLLSEWKNS